MRISEYSLNEQANRFSATAKKERPGHIDTLAENPTRAAFPLDVMDFAAVVAATPLISIDLIVRGEAGKVLFGLRKNPPAEGSWFVPGGRIYKNETLDIAFRRIVRSELGIDLNRSESHMMGVFEHFYDVNFLGEEGMNTHYVVLAHSIFINPESMNLPQQQHSEYVWLPEADICRNPDIHPYAKAYFRNE